MVNVKVRITGEKVALLDSNKHEIRVNGYIDTIYFIAPLYNQTIFPVDKGKETWYTFHGNSLTIISQSEKEIMISGDIISFDGYIDGDEEMRHFRVIPYSILVIDEDFLTDEELGENSESTISELINDRKEEVINNLVNNHAEEMAEQLLKHGIVMTGRNFDEIYLKYFGKLMDKILIIKRYNEQKGKELEERLQRVMSNLFEKREVSELKELENKIFQTQMQISQAITFYLLRKETQ